MNQLSIHQAFDRRQILMVGASGFLGKIWLAMVLERIPDVGRIFLLLRKNGRGQVTDRLESMFNHSYVFKPLHERFGPKLAEYLATRVEVIEGNITQPDLGIEDSVATKLRENLDLVINCAGLVDFNPDLRDAISVNVDGTKHVADFTNSCAHASMLHVSTCYVVGKRDGKIEETLDYTTSPNGKPFDPQKEYVEIRTRMAKILETENDPAVIEERRKVFLEKHQDKKAKPSPKRMEKTLEIWKRKHLRDQMVAEGMTRAAELGWQNTYTYVKALAEGLIAHPWGKEGRYTIFRPAIVESSMAYPFPGWNEGFNTSGPLAYLLKTWFRYLPAKTGNPFDIVPVDLVGQGLIIAAAALLEGKHFPVYQCGTSHLNCFTIDRACELTSLSHRQYYRKHGKNFVERNLLSRWETVAAPADHFFSVTNLKRIMNWAKNGLDRLFSYIRPRNRAWLRTKGMVDRATRKLTKVEDLLKLFLPFTHDHRHVFQTKALRDHELAEPEFTFSPESIDWRKYWLEIHMPGLRRWCFPAIEGKEKEMYKPTYPVRWKSFQPESRRSQPTPYPHPQPRPKEIH